MKTKLDSMNECYNSLLEATVPEEILSTGVVVVKEGLAFISINQGFKLVSSKIS